MIIYDVVTLIGHVMGDIYDKSGTIVSWNSWGAYDFYLSVLAGIYFYRHII